MLSDRRSGRSSSFGDSPVKNRDTIKTISEAKTGTSCWLKEISPKLSDFAWQEGYGAFSLSPKDLDAVLRYIDLQEEHHRKISFQDEFRKFLKQYAVEYDENYVWG